MKQDDSGRKLDDLGES